MFKKIFSAAKNLLRNPVAQVGIGLLLPQTSFIQNLAKTAPILANPAVLQGGIGLLAGDKPENVLRNIAFGTAARGIDSMLQPGGSFMGGVQSGLGMTPAATSNIPIQGKVYDPLAGSSGAVRETVAQEVAKPGLLKRITGSLINEDETDFFAKYSPLLKLGAVGATIASAVMSEDEKDLFYDPTKNPYLASGSADKDFFENINPYYSMNKGGGVMDFPEKDGMINGPGDGQSDDIPAMLSDGEFVMTKQAVMAAGNGNRNEGTKKMYDMMYSLEDKARNMGIGRV